MAIAGQDALIVNGNGSSAAGTRRVAIIGGGSAGVVQARELLKLNEESGETLFEPTIYERRAVLGSGLWSLDADPGPCHITFGANGRAYPRWETTSSRNWPPGAMYDGLKTNIPSDLMTYRDAPFGNERGTGLFPTRGQVEAYLKEYAEQDERVPRRARLSTTVKDVRRISCSEGIGSERGHGSKWSVTSFDHVAEETTTEAYDLVVFANGRCSVPSIPPIHGLWNFKGRLFHSAWYRTPVVFQGQKVLIVGNNSSGMDIAREICGHIVRDFAGRDEWLQKVAMGATGTRVINSVEDITKPPNLDYDPRDADSPAWSKKIEVVPQIASVREDGVVVLQDGRELDDVDTLVFGTGFYVQWESVDHTVEPFKSAPLVRPARDVVTSSDLEREPGLVAKLHEQEQNAAKLPPLPSLAQPANSGPSSLDDWYLFYEPDRSLVFLGLPTGNVPFPLTHVQARFVAAFWAGQADILPAIDRELPPTEASRWSMPPLQFEGGKPRGLNPGPMPLVFGHPSDMDYLDGLLSHVHGAGGQPPWEREALEAAEQIWESEMQGGCGDASEAEEVKQAYLDEVKSALKAGPELWYNVAAWRRKRRRDNKILRRKEIGY